MSPEEILYKHATKDDWEFDKYDPGFQISIRSMDEYAKQQSIAFHRWAFTEGFILWNHGYWLASERKKQYQQGKKYTGEELYNLFIEHQSKQP